MANPAHYAGDFFLDESGKKLYQLLENAEHRGNYYIVHAYDIAAKRDCFLKYVMSANLKEANRSNLVRESRFRMYYPYLERVFTLFKGYDKDQDGVFGVSVEWVQGEDLTDAVKILHGRVVDGELSEAEAEAITFRQIWQFVHGMDYYITYAAEAYLHRDIKHQNIRIKGTRGEGDVCIIDFDFAHISGSQGTLRIRGQEVGFTLGYASPNVIALRRIDRLPGIREEIYSAGRTIFYWLNGRDYFRPDERTVPREYHITDKADGAYSLEELAHCPYCSVRSLGYGLDRTRMDARYLTAKYEKLLQILERMCADPLEGDGYSTMGEVAEDLDAFLREYYGSEENMERMLKLNQEPLLRSRRKADEEKAPCVYAKVEGSPLGRRGHALQEYTMRDIMIGSRVALTIYRIKDKICYIMAEGTEKVNAREKGSSEEYFLQDGDVFLCQDRHITITIRR